MEGEAISKFVDSLQTDLKLLSTETRKRYPQIREACEEALNRLRSVPSNPQPLLAIKGILNQVLYPVIQGSETKDPKLVKVCLGVMQKLITQEILDEKSSTFITGNLWMLMENGIEEVKVLQTTALLLTISDLVRGEGLAKCVVLCFRLHFSKDPIVSSIAGATVRQLVSLVFERVVAEDSASSEASPSITEAESSAGKNLKPFASDAFSLFKDLVLLVNAEQPCWLLGMTEMTRTFGIELLEMILSSFQSVFCKHSEFITLLKDRVCALVIKLFSPNVKSQHRYNPGSGGSQAAGGQQQQLPATTIDKPFFPISMRLLRLVSVLIQKYYALLVTECEIFLSLVIKFLDPDKPTWQRALALEILHRLLAQPALVKSFCESYDMKPHATNILQDTVNSLAACVQSLFVTSAPGQAQAGSSSAVPANPGTSQAGFFYRGVWIPITVTFSSGQPKPTFLDLLDKPEPPPIPEGYCMSVAYFCLLDIVRSLSLIVDNNCCDGGSLPEQLGSIEKNPEEQSALHAQLVNSSWCGLLAALTLLLDASTDETSTENVLKALQSCADISGRADLQTPRDAFVTALCKASLPPHYTLTVLNAVPAGTVATRVHSRQPSSDGYGTSQYTGGSGTETEFRQHLVVAVGSPLPMPSIPAGSQQGPVVLTAKNLQCMRAVLSVAHCHGSILGSAWHLVLTTLQHLAWILGLKPSVGGSLKSSRPAMEPSTSALVPSTSPVLADLPVLSSMLSRLFESSQYLDDVALHHLIDALCQLSQEAMEVAYSNREPSLFAVAKLLETGLVNLGRVETLWRPVTNHLLEVCGHPASRMREWGVESLTTLVKAAVQYQHDPPLKDNKKLQTLLLSPLSELSSTSYADVRQKQVECVLQLLNSSGDVLSYGWPLILNMIGAINNTQGESLIRSAFQCLQLVVTDYLPVLPARCLPLAVEATGKFGSQTQELNVSLTAIGLMWNVSDYFYQNRETLQKWLSEEKAKVFPNFPGIANMEAFDKLWMCLYTKLGELCIDSRPAVRKSSGQTLFTTITAHGDLLQHSTWQAVMWQVLFPLLEKVKTFSSQASDEKVDTSGSILIHHSRNTAQKQWAETQVLTLSGVARVFHAKRSLLQNLGDFSRAWALLLEFIENSALSRNSEVSLAALKSFQDVLSPQAKTSTNQDSEGEEMIWNLAWKIWLSIGSQSTTPPTEAKGAYLPAQPFLTALVLIFPGLFQHIKTRFVSTDLQKLCTVLESSICVPVHGEASPFVLASMNESILTPLQEGVLLCIDTVQKELVVGNELTQSMLPLLFTQLLTFSKYSCQTPSFGKLEARPISTFKANQMDWVSVNYVPFGEKCLTMAIHLFESCSQFISVINAHVFTNIIHALRLPLSLKYDCSSQTTWRLAVHSLIRALKAGLPVACKAPETFQNLWTEISSSFDEFLFPKSMAPASQTPEEAQADELLDCLVIELIRDEILPQAVNYPPQFVLRLMALLNKGSIHSVDPDLELKTKIREEFSKVCFETLLRFSILHEEEKAATDTGDKTNFLAITSLLNRFEDVLKRFVEDEKLSGKCPLPRYRVSELSFTLQSLTTLIASLKKISAHKVNLMTWRQLIGLYPFLVDLTSSVSTPIGRSLREALKQYADLLQPPTSSVTNGT